MKNVLKSDTALWGKIMFWSFPFFCILMHVPDMFNELPSDRFDSYSGFILF
jgi:hypothetical protein